MIHHCCESGLNASCRVKLIEGEDDGLHTEVRGKKMRQIGNESAAGLPAALVDDGGPCTNTADRLQPAGRSIAARRRHPRVPKLKSRGPAPASSAAQDPATRLEHSKPVRRVRIIPRSDFETPRSLEEAVVLGKRMALDGTLRLPFDACRCHLCPLYQQI